MSKIYKTKIVENIKVAENTLQISFDRPEEFNFEPGQYTQVGVEKLKYSDPKGASRVFSVCSSSTEKKVSIVFRETGSGFKKTLSEFNIGEEILLEEPLGSFVFPLEDYGSHIFIAGGIGIAPFMSILKTLEEMKREIPITLIYANSDETKASFIKELQVLNEKFNWFSLVEIYGHLEQGHITPYIKQGGLENDWWIVGPPNMVVNTKHTLESLGVFDGNIYTEEFIGY
jgi:ferredoxin-NADP reductase